MDDLKISLPRAPRSSADVGLSTGAAFADALAAIDDAPALRMLMRGLDAIERGRAEAAALPERVTLAHSRGAPSADVVLAMHRQARLMASYQIDVMWAARVVGATAAGLRQLITAA